MESAIPNMQRSESHTLRVCLNLTLVKIERIFGGIFAS